MMERSINAAFCDLAPTSCNYAERGCFVRGIEDAYSAAPDPRLASSAAASRYDSAPVELGS